MTKQNGVDHTHHSHVKQLVPLPNQSASHEHASHHLAQS